MLIVISPAKTLDFESPLKTGEFTMPEFLDESAELVRELRELPPQALGRLMGVSPRLAALNAERYQAWKLPFTNRNARQAVLAFKGDVYGGLDAAGLSQDELQYAQGRLRILSGLYGVLKPLDLIQPYRLEMGTRLKTRRGDNLYDFWQERINAALNAELQQQQEPVLVNLASNEYFKAVRPKALKARIITPAFKEKKNGEYRMISFFAKKARGLMSRYIIRNRLEDPAALRGFDLEGYRYNPAVSTADGPAFTRGDAP